MPSPVRQAGELAAWITRPVLLRRRAVMGVVMALAGWSFVGEARASCGDHLLTRHSPGLRTYSSTSAEPARPIPPCNGPGCRSMPSRQPTVPALPDFSPVAKGTLGNPAPLDSAYDDGPRFPPARVDYPRDGFWIAVFRPPELRRA